MRDSMELDVPKNFDSSSPIDNERFYPEKSDSRLRNSPEFARETSISDRD
jgi:hypothetical protein